ncbi:UNKNOWN [Stylonychia lemnae]|uniref:Mitochondrial import inner membrane translocase subunit n=1 Tax=Stylonychia lemnae TaxID=5949 RepID=A0A078AED8_STYLE|nr:UNKNOWN [Stylonychia lemnae]|eukprot:CDW80201.1 UNKNOWN [Stylonychia lemnae]
MNAQSIKPLQLKVEDISRILNSDKMLLSRMSDTCFRRCIASFEREYLNPLEQNCVDRCIYKYDQMIREVMSPSSQQQQNPQNALQKK